MHEPLVPMRFPVLGARDCVEKFQYLTSFGGGVCGQMARIMADFGGNKWQFPKSKR